MDIVATFDPSATATGTFSSNLSNGIGKIIIWNESNWTLDITFTNGYTDVAPAWTATILHLDGPSGKLTWKQDTQLVGASAPISKVWVVAYRDNETIPGIFPVALVRQVNVGSTVNVAGTLNVTTTTVSVNALALYGSNVASTTLTTADKFATATGGAETSNTTGNGNAATGPGWLEIYSQGIFANNSLFASVPSPTGNGWLLDATTLEGKSISAGNWSSTLTLQDTGAGSQTLPTTIDLFLRYSKRSSGGAYTTISSITLSSQTYDTTKRIYTLPPTAASSAGFSTGDKLYIELWAHNANWQFVGGPGGGGVHIQNYVSTSAATGLANDMQINTPGTL